MSIAKYLHRLPQHRPRLVSRLAGLYELAGAIPVRDCLLTNPNTKMKNILFLLILIPSIAIAQHQKSYTYDECDLYKKLYFATSRDYDSLWRRHSLTKDSLDNSLYYGSDSASDQLNRLMMERFHEMYADSLKIRDARIDSLNSAYLKLLKSH